MNDQVVNHREAARVFREQVKYWENKGKRRRSNFFREQANWHDREANRLEDNEDILKDNQNLFLLLAKEIYTKTGEVAFRRIQGSGVGVVVIRHPFMNIVLDQKMPLSDIPGWIPETEEGESWVGLDEETQNSIIDRYLRPLEGG